MDGLDSNTRDPMNWIYRAVEESAKSSSICLMPENVETFLSSCWEEVSSSFKDAGLALPTFGQTVSELQEIAKKYRSGYIQQSTIDQVVDEIHAGEVSNKTLNQFCSQSSPYDDYFSVSDEPVICWIRDGDAFDKSELCYWESYFDVDFFTEAGIPESKLESYTNGTEPTAKEYGLFLKKWVAHSFGHFDYADIPVASIHTLTHSDGRTCVALLSMTEGGQGGWEFYDVFVDLYLSPDDAINHLKGEGIIEGYSAEELDNFIKRSLINNSGLQVI